MTGQDDCLYRTDCLDCRRDLEQAGWPLVARCSSVGIEAGKSAGEMIRVWIQGRHQHHGGVETSEPAG
jgi:hypothetical protein